MAGELRKVDQDRENYSLSLRRGQKNRILREDGHPFECKEIRTMNYGAEDLAISAWAEDWSERAAILEYDAGMTREQAEKEADRLCPQENYLYQTRIQISRRSPPPL